MLCRRVICPGEPANKHITLLIDVFSVSFLLYRYCNVKSKITWSSKSEFSINFQPICDLIAANEEENNGSTLIHCMQGRSRSASLVIAYLLWKDGCSDASGGKDTKEKG